MDLKDKRVLVVGLGKSGVASALFLKARGARVTVSDAKSPRPTPRRNSAVARSWHRRRDRRPRRTHLPGQDLIVVSPGVPVDAPPLVQARASGEPVIGEIELAAQISAGPIVAITGSNGKTTTTTLAGDIITAGGFPTVVGGNIGTPAISLVERAARETVIVLEISSFQLETIQTFRPKIAVILNVTPDHLDRHRTFQTYVDAKARIFENQQPTDFAVLNADDPTCVDPRRSHPRPGLLVQPQEGSEAGRVRATAVASFFVTPAGRREVMSGQRDSAQRRAQRGERSGRVSARAR